MGKWSTSSPSSPMSSSPPSLSWDCKRCSLSSAHLFYLNPGFIHCNCHPGWFCRWYHRLLPEPGLGTTLQRFWHLGRRLHPGREIFWRRKKVFKNYTFQNQTQVSMFRFSTLWGLPTAPTFFSPRIIPSTATATGNLIKQYRYLNTTTFILESKENTDNKNYDYNNNEQI